MHRRPLPGPVHPAARAAVDVRWAQVQRRLGVATAVRVLAGVLAVVVLPAAHGPTTGVLVLVALLLLAHAGLGLVEHDPTHRRTPLRWTVLATASGILAGACAVLALLPVLAGLDLLTADLAGLAVAVLVASTVLVATSRAADRVRATGCPEIGGTELRFWLPARHTGRWWANPGTAILVTADELRLSTVLGRTPERRVPLASVRAVSLLAGPTIRLDAAASWGGPDVTLLDVGEDGPGGTEDAADLAAVLRYRVWSLTGTAPADHPPAPPAPPAAAPTAVPRAPGPAVATLPTTDFRTGRTEPRPGTAPGL